jgi:hypothetical protein
LQRGVGERWDEKGEKPRSEPEIIAPSDATSRTARVRVSVDRRGTERIYIAQPGPLGFILVVLVTAILLAVMFVLLFGAFLILTPIVLFFAAGLIVAGLVRGYFQRGR